MWQPGQVIEIQVLEDAEALAKAVADRIANFGRASIEQNGQFCLAVSGGTTPSKMLGELATRPVPWDKVHLFQVDERVAPDGDPSRNLTILRSVLLDRISLPAQNLHAMPVTSDDLQAAAVSYGKEMKRVCGEGRGLDLIHLGLGDDGHTASWPPGDPIFEITDRDVAVVGPFNGLRRMTLTPPAVNATRSILWMVSGEKKAGVLRRMLEGDPELPASRVRRSGAVVLADRPAAAQGPDD